MFKPLEAKRTGELSPAQLEDARLGFNQLLRRHMSPQWIERNAEDLFGKALLEYSRKLEEDEEIRRPGAFIVTCAWQRTKSALEAERREPRQIPIEIGGPLSADLGEGPEEAALTADRLRQVQEAVERLSADERRLLELAYFEGMSVREAGRRLNWHSSKVQRAHKTARKRLRELLGVDSLDELEVIVGLAAYLSFVEGRHTTVQLPAGVEAAAQDGAEKARHLWSRGEGLIARFLNLGGEPSGLALGGAAGKAAGVCAAAAIACFTSGVVGPGVGGLIESGQGSGAVRSSHRPTAITRSAPERSAPPSAPSPVHRGAPVSTPAAGGHSADEAAKQTEGDHRESRQAQASKTANASLGIESAASPQPEKADSASPEEGASVPDETEPAPETETTSSPTHEATAAMGIEGAAP